MTVTSIHYDPGTEILKVVTDEPTDDEHIWYGADPDVVTEVMAGLDQWLIDRAKDRKQAAPSPEQLTQTLAAAKRVLATL